MEISATQVSHAGERQWSATQGDKTTQSLLAQNSMLPAAGEQLLISHEAELVYKMKQLFSFNAESTVTDRTNSKSDIADDSKVVTYSQNELFEKVIQNTVAGEQAVTIIRSVGGGESTMLQGEVKIQLNEYIYYSQQQSAAISFSGNIVTEDGRSIDFTMHLLMEQSQRYDFNQSITIERRPLTDPIVMNFSSESVKLSNAVFEFDIDADGDNETLTQLGSGSGFLALDRNGDGVINDGRELFGSSTGNGFGELTYLDSDQNGWIDENDPIFNQLSVMLLNNQGEQELHSLKEMGVGAIYLGSEESSIDMMDANGMLLGAVKRTSIFLMEDGQVKTIQELDLADMKTSQSNVNIETIVISGDPLPPQPTAIGNVDVSYYGIVADIRKQQEEFLKTQEDITTDSRVTYLGRLFEQIDRASERLRDLGQRVSARYWAINSDD